MKKSFIICLLGASSLLALASCGVDLGNEITTEQFTAKADIAVKRYEQETSLKQLKIGHIKIKYRDAYENGGIKKDKTYELDKDVGDNLVIWALSLTAEEKMAWNYFAGTSIDEVSAEYFDQQGLKFYEKANESLSMTCKVDEKESENKAKQDTTFQWDTYGRSTYCYSDVNIEYTSKETTVKSWRHIEYSADITYLVSNS